jgi:peptidoglycan-associated lipoprotein
MTQFALKRFLIVLLLALAIVSCGKKVAPAPAPPPPPPPPPPAPTVTLSANPTTITAGQSVTLNYTSTGATAVTIDPGIGTVQPAGSGTRQVSPTATTTYRATASGPGGAAQPVSVVVTVNPAAPPPRDPNPPAKVDNTPVVPARTIADIFKDTMKDVYFDYDKYAIRTDQERNLLSMASWLKQNPTVRFRIEGNADERGSQEYNIALGDERASAVMKYLSTQGIAESRMTTVSYGEERPVCREQTEDCWQKNRRAAFVLVP